MKKSLLLSLLINCFISTGQDLQFVQEDGHNKIDLIFQNDSSFPKLAKMSHYFCCLGSPHNAITPAFNLHGTVRVFNNSATNTNVYLKISALDSSGQTIQNLYSDTILSLNAGDTVLLSSSSLLPPEILRTKNLAYRVYSDQSNILSDSLKVDYFIEDDFIFSPYFQGATGSIGTNELANDGASISFKSPVWDQLEGFEVALNLHPSTVAGGDIHIDVYKDTVFGNSPTDGTLLFSKTKMVQSNHINDTMLFSFMNNSFIANNNSFYHIVITLFSNNGNNPITLKTSKLIRQGPGVIFYNNYSGWKDQIDTSNFIGNPHIDIYPFTPHLDPIASLEKNSLSFTVYPNPADDFIIIQKPGTTNSIVEIHNLNGQLIRKMSHDFRTGEYKLDISDFAAGIYFLKISDNTHDGVNKKFIIH